MATHELNDRELDSPGFERVHKFKAKKESKSKVEAFKRYEKTMFEDLKNLLGTVLKYFQLKD